MLGLTQVLMYPVRRRNFAKLSERQGLQFGFDEIAFEKNGFLKL